MKGPLAWQIATVKAIKPETTQVKSFTLELPEWTRHRAGQHYDIRLTAEDGYQAQRSYSIASEPERAGEIDLTVERIPDGEASTYLHDVLVPGDRIEVRGPIGGYFVWEATAPASGLARFVGLSAPEPLLLIGGGSGVVPLMSMLRHRAAAGAKNPARLLYSSRSFEDVIYYDELEKLGASGDGLAVVHTLTRSQPGGWKGYARRIDGDMLSEVTRPLGRSLQVFICGPTLLVEAASDTLVKIGVHPAQIRTERFGPSGTTTGG
jgi:ferredoxin-NADP reductase